MRRTLAQMLHRQDDRYLQAAGNMARAVVFGIVLTALAQALLAGMSYAVANAPNPVFLALVTFLAASPFVFTEVLGLSRVRFGMAILSMSVFYIGGTFLCRRLLARFGLLRTVAVGGGMTFAAGTVMGLLTLGGAVSVWTLLPPFWLYATAHGIHQSCGQAGAVSPFPRMAGAASAMNGVLMMSMAFAIGG